jgi:NAD(P)H-hydrate epimerase
MTEILTSAQMRATERAAIDSATVTGLALMERAGVGVVAAILALWPDRRLRVVVLCGPGNNGGDGYVVARLLHDLGWTVTVFNHGDPARLPPDARANYDSWVQLGPVTPMTEQALAGVSCDVVVDALFGIGQRAPMDAVLAPVTGLMRARPYVVAVDLPTGYDADTGAALARHPMPADLIVTFHAKKPCHVLPPLCDIPQVVVDLALPGAAQGAR